MRHQQLSHLIGFESLVPCMCQRGMLPQSEGMSTLGGLVSHVIFKQNRVLPYAQQATMSAGVARACKFANSVPRNMTMQSGVFGV